MISNIPIFNIFIETQIPDFEKMISKEENGWLFCSKYCYSCKLSDMCTKLEVFPTITNEEKEEWEKEHPEYVI